MLSALPKENVWVKGIDATADKLRPAYIMRLDLRLLPPSVPVTLELAIKT